MPCPSPQFLMFAAIVAAAFWLGRAPWWRQALMLVANIGFLASFTPDPRGLLPYAGFLLLGYGGIHLRQRCAPRFVGVGVIAAVLLAFVWLKRCGFVPPASFLPFPYVVLGLSYVFFRVLHLVIDAGGDAWPSRVGLVSYLNYALNFPCMVAGPIQRYEDHRRTEQLPAPLTWDAASAATRRIAIGYGKIAILGALLSGWQLDALAALSPDQSWLPRVGTAMAIAMLYPLFLYCNFSGYTDFVIGVARLLGQALPENFDRPFAAANVLDFWGRWHITLSSWLKTYVYNPLLMALMRRFSGPVQPFLGVFAFFVTFFLVGLWHGQTSLFITFGLLTGAGVAANKLYQVEMVRRLGRKRYRAMSSDPLYAAGCRGLTITWFAFTLFWFWSSWAQMGRILAAVGAAGAILGWIGLLVLTIAAPMAWPMIRAACVPPTRWAPVPRAGHAWVGSAVAVGAILAMMLILRHQQVPAVVYQAF